MELTVKINGHEVEYSTAVSHCGEEGENGIDCDLEPYYDVIKITSEYDGHETIARDLSSSEVYQLFEQIQQGADK